MKKIFKKISERKNSLMKRLSFYFFENKTKKIIFFLIATLIISGCTLVFSITYAASAAYVQSSWIGGLDSSVMATQTGWTKYYTSINVTPAATVTLAATSGTSVQTTDANFNSWTVLSGTAKYVGGNSLTKKKADGGSCTVDAQCTSGWCAVGSGTCRTCTANTWGGVASGGYCWYRGSSKYNDSTHPNDGASCDTICAYNGMSCSSAQWNDNSSCSIMSAVWPAKAGNSCSSGPFYEGSHNPEWTWDANRIYRVSGGDPQTCSAGALTSERARLCACQ